MTGAQSRQIVRSGGYVLAIVAAATPLALAYAATWWVILDWWFGGL